MLILKKLGFAGIALQKWERGVLEVWQAKGLRERICGSVATTGVTGEIADVWQGKELRDSGEWRMTSGEKAKQDQR